MASAQRTTIVKNSGTRLTARSAHRWRNSSLWFFFIIMLRRKGEIRAITTTPHTADGSQPMPVGVSRRVSKGKRNINERMMTATVRVE